MSVFENALMATRKRSKETNFDFIAGFDLLSTLISNAFQLKVWSFEEKTTKICTKRVNSFKPFFAFRFKHLMGKMKL